MGGENDDKVSKVMTCSLSLGSFVFVHPGRRKFAISSGFSGSKQPVEFYCSLQLFYRKNIACPLLDFILF